jgi:hypothetical protein
MWILLLTHPPERSKPYAWFTRLGLSPSPFAQRPGPATGNVLFR